MTNYLADELRQIVAALDDTPLMGQPVHRQLLALTERVQALGDEPAEHELDAIAGGLEPEQEIRARAAEIIIGSGDGPRVLVVRGLLSEIHELATYIRDGSQPPASTACTCPQIDVTPHPGAVPEYLPGVPDPACPQHGSRP